MTWRVFPAILSEVRHRFLKVAPTAGNWNIKRDDSLHLITCSQLIPYPHTLLTHSSAHHFSAYIPWEDGRQCDRVKREKEPATQSQSVHQEECSHRQTPPYSDSHSAGHWVSSPASSMSVWWSYQFFMILTVMASFPRGLDSSDW